MELVADILLVAGAVGAGFYCFVLSRRLSKFNDLEKGVGGAVAVLSSQVDDLTKTLASARDSADGANVSLTELTERAEAVAKRLELQLASLHDVADIEPPKPAEDLGVVDITPAVNGPMFVRHERTMNGSA